MIGCKRFAGISGACSAAFLCASIVAGLLPGSAFAGDSKEMARCDMSVIKSEREFAAPPGEKPPVVRAPFNTVAMTDPAMLRKIFAANPVIKRSPTGTLQVSASLFNCTDYPLQIEARTQFFDSSEQPTEAVSAWKRVYLAPRTDSYYQESSVAVEAQLFEIDLREGH
jgi:hypothetical protein